MTSSNDKSTNSQKVNSKHYEKLSSHRHKSTYQSTAMQIQVSCSFSRTHDVPCSLWLGFIYGSTSLRRLRRLSTYVLERQAMRWNPLPVVPGAGRSVLILTRTEDHCQSQRKSSSACIDQVLSQLLQPFFYSCRHLVSNFLGEQVEALQRWWLTLGFSCKCIQIT